MTLLAGQKVTASAFNALDPSTYPFMEAIQSSAQTAFASGATTLISFQTKVVDSHTAFSTSTFLYTVPVAGWYQIDAAVHWTGSATGIRWCRLIQAGSGSATLIGSTSAGSSTVTCAFSGPVLCAAGDTLGIQSQQTSGGSLAPTAGSGFTSSFSARFLRLP